MLIIVGMASCSGSKLSAQALAPVDVGTTVNGFQDDFDGSALGANWAVRGGDVFSVGGGALHVNSASGDPNHLLYELPGYNDTIQEMLARVRIANVDSGDGVRGGVAVGVDSASSQGINYHFRDNTSDGQSAYHMAFLDDLRAWGPVQNFVWQANTWYWMRIRQEPDAASQGGANDVFAKIWLADGSVAEPAGWQLTWDYTSAGFARAGFAGITASSAGGIFDFDVDYVLIKATGLPSILVAPRAFVQSQVAITNQPQSRIVAELSPASFTAGVSGNPAPTMQWYRNNSLISGATNATYTLSAAAMADNNAGFKLVAANTVSNVNHFATSQVATLTVIADTNRPVLLGAQSLGLSQVQVTLSERITAATATNLANFSITNAGGSLAIFSAILDGSQSNIVLSVGAMVDGTTYTLTVNNLADPSAAGNVVAANSQVTFIGSAYALLPVGNPTPAGSQVPAGNGYNITGGGADLGGASDQFQFSYQLRTGDFDFKVRLDSLSLADAWSEAGLVARENLTPGSRSAAALATPSISGAYFQSRTTAGGNTALAGSFPVNYPNTWLRLKRAGNVFSGFAGYDGQNWTQLGTVSISLPAGIYVGFAVSSHNTNQLTTAAFRDFGVVTAAGTNPPPELEPPGQSSRRTSLVISEIMYHPPDTRGTINTNAQGFVTNSLEYVEILNTRGEFQDLGGFQLAGSIDYTFPAGTVIPGGGFLVVARSPVDVESVYGISGVLGPFTNNLPNNNGSVQLISQGGGVFLEVEYDSVAPWPVAADGGGSSLVLSRPSYGENNAHAWTASDSIGGSPGRLDPFTPDPLRQVVINEFLAHTDDPEVDYIELYNHGTQPVLIGGCILSDDAETNKFVIPAGTTIPARGFAYFTQTNMNFSLSADGETIFFKNPAGTRVLDAVRFEGQENGVASGRFPDGSDQIYRLISKTPGSANAAVRVSQIAINELMYSPLSKDDDDQYIELYNRGPGTVNLGGWRLDGGIGFTFPGNASITADSYLVIARNAAHLRTNYTNLTVINTVGDFSGKLSGRGERVALTMPDTIVVTNNGSATTNLIHITVDEVTYGTGGQWPHWSDGGGSSLELVDPRSNHRLPSNWADSNESTKAPWTIVSATGTIDNGSTGGADQLQVLLPRAGECLVDDVQVLNASSVNLIANSSFESGAAGWTAEGTESPSGIQNTEGYNSARSYHVRALDRGDNQVNRIRTSLTTTLNPGTANVTIRAAVRWLKGPSQVLLRLGGNWLECAAEMTLPVRPGTPGARNSRYTANTPPAITDVQHTPVLPAAAQPFVVTAHAEDFDGLSSVSLKYRLDPSAAYSTLAMTDNGSGGDAVAGDGVYSATIPGQPAGTLIAFYLQSTDQFSPAATASYPADAPVRECLVRVGETQPTGNFPVYRLWMTQATLNTWTTRNKLDNTPLNVTFALGNQRVIHNAQALYAGSPFISPGYNGPAGNPCGYSISMPEDDGFLGEEDLVLDWPGGHGSESSAMQEQMGYWIADRMNLPFSHRHIIRLHVNGVTDDARGQVFEAVVQPAGTFLKQWSPNASDGQFFKIDRAFDFDDSGNLIAAPPPLLQNFTTTGGAKKREAYRWNWNYRSTDRVNDYTNIFTLVDAVNASGPEPYTSATLGLVDMEEWMGILATEHIIVNFDAYGHQIGKNMYAYLPEGGKWQLYMFDLDWLMLAAVNYSSSYGPSTAPLFNSEDPTISRMYAHPPFARAYWRAIEDAVNGPLDGANCNPVMDAKYQSLRANGIAWCDGQPLAAPTPVKNWFSQRRAALQSQLGTVAAPFAVNPSVVVSNNIGIISGTAPVGVASVWFNGAEFPLTWTSVTGWTARVPLKPGSNALSVVGVDRNGQPVAGASNNVAAVYSGALPSPVGQVVINEIMYDPAVAGGEYLELYNNSTNITFDLSGWRFDGLSYTFPAGASIGPRGYLILTADRPSFAGAYGALIPVFDTYAGSLQGDGETLSLVRPGTNAATDLVVSKLRYEGGLPWPAGANGTGSSLQLIDSKLDNWRAGNWSGSYPPASRTPGTLNSVAATLPAFPTLWINEVQAGNLTGITNSAGQRTAWLELHNPGPAAVSLSGLYLANNYANLTNWAFPAGSSINPGEFKVIFADGQTGLSTLSELHTSFAMSVGGGSLAMSRIYNGKLQVLDYLNYTNLVANHSYGSFPDGLSFDRQDFFYVTPGRTNDGTSAPLSVSINEWMADNTRTLFNPIGGQADDWFELYNRGDTPANLAGFYLTDALNDPFQFLIPPGYVIPPHGFLIVWADNQLPTGSGDLHVNFKLSKTASSIGLYGVDGIPVDYVTFGAQATDISQGRFPDAAAGIIALNLPSPGTNNIGSNTAPTLTPIGSQTATLGQTISFSAFATDPDLPPQTLTFSLGTGAPSGASVNPSTGQFVWTPSAAPATNVIALIVTDNGSPNLSATQTFTVTVFPAPQLTGAAIDAGRFTFGWPTTPGQQYQVEYKDTLSVSGWLPFGAPVVGTGGLLTFTHDLTGAQRYFRVTLVQ